jgi:hypothetical protein
MWDQSTESLKFNIYAPHLDMNGDPFRGFFKARIPIAWLNCAFPGNTLALASQLFVSIIYEDGSVQVAFTYNRITKDYIYVEVPDFHYSSPTIAISKKAPIATAQIATPAPASSPSPSPSPTVSVSQDAAPQATQSPAPKIQKSTSVLCQKGKVKKKFAGKKCPSGWKVQR